MFLSQIKLLKIWLFSFYKIYIGLGGHGVTCSPRDPRIVGSNPAEVDGFFKDVKILSTSPLGVPSLRFQAR